MSGVGFLIFCGLGRRVGGTGVVAPLGKAVGSVGGARRAGALWRARASGPSAGGRRRGRGAAGVPRWWCGWREPGETLKALPSLD